MKEAQNLDAASIADLVYAQTSRCDEHDSYWPTETLSVHYNRQRNSTTTTKTNQYYNY